MQRLVTVFDLARLVPVLGLLVLPGPVAAAQGQGVQPCPAGQVPVRKDYAGDTVQGVQEKLRRDGDGLYVGIFENGTTRPPLGDEWGREVAGNAENSLKSKCKYRGEFVGVLLPPPVRTLTGPEPVGAEKGELPAAPNTWLWATLVGAAAFLAGVFVGRASKKGA